MSNQINIIKNNSRVSKSTKIKLLKLNQYGLKVNRFDFQT